MRRFILLFALTLAACGGPKLHVESDTSWSGFVGGSDNGTTVDGSGDRIFELRAGTTCWNFQKQTTGGRLRAYARSNGIFSGGTQGDATTTAEYGVVSGCTD